MIPFLKLRSFIACFAMILVAALFPLVVNGQSRSYRHEAVDYVLHLPSAEWRTVRVPGVAHTSTEFRYGDQTQVHLRIRRELVDAGVTPQDLVQRQQSLDRVFLRGYVKGTSESFEGRLSGAKYPYEYISAGKPIAGLIYYLQANNRIIYRVEFTGPPHNVARAVRSNRIHCSKLPVEVTDPSLFRWH